MKKALMLAASITLSGCADKMPEYDPDPVISQFTALFNPQGSMATEQRFTLQPNNITAPCVVTYTATQAPQIDDLRWYGECQNGEASGLGLVILSSSGTKSNSVEFLTPGGINDIAYYQHNIAQDFYDIGVGNNQGYSGKTLRLYRDGVYLSPVEGYFSFDRKQQINYSLMRNPITGMTSYMKMDRNGTGLALNVYNDYTNNIAQNIRIGQQNHILLEAVKLQNGTVVTSQNGQYLNAQTIMPFVSAQLSELDSKLVSAPSAYAEATRKIAELKNRLCPAKENAEVAAFCDDQPFSAYQSEFERTAQAYHSAQQQRLANIESQRVEAMRQQQIAQQNYQALNASLAQLNQTTQQLQRNVMQNMPTYAPPSPTITNYNQTSIYTCQDVSNWTYCRQQR
ncbi:MAG TPA: hypothetical protein DEF92_07200 [Leclercia adecarboxylata]|nr:hypothetical protein [Leclercia adecarboxylata]